MITPAPAVPKYRVVFVLQNAESESLGSVETTLPLSTISRGDRFHTAGLSHTWGGDIDSEYTVVDVIHHITSIDSMVSHTTTIVLGKPSRK
jgi:hypothetical protein